MVRFPPYKSSLIKIFKMKNLFLSNISIQKINLQTTRILMHRKQQTGFGVENDPMALGGSNKVSLINN